MASTSSTSIETEQTSVDLATGFGPRIVGLRPGGVDNVFASLGDLGIDLPDGRRFVFHGGHRLWLAPEVPELTYEPDGDPVDVATDGRNAYATGRTGPYEKSIHVEVDETSAKVTVDHVVTNRSDRAFDIALWAITQLRPGGVALLPINDRAIDPNGLQASSHVVGWPYTDWAALGWDRANGVARIDGKRDTPTKIGTELSRGWLAYIVDGWLFAKYATSMPSPVDFGATGQIYACPDFVELETLGPLVTLEPGATAAHREIWRVWPAPSTTSEAAALVERSCGHHVAVPAGDPQKA